MSESFTVLDLEEKTNSTQRYAGFWIRLLAFILDVAITMILDEIIYSFQEEGTDYFYSLMLPYLFFSILLPLLLLCTLGGTLGMLAVRLQLRRKIGGAVSWKEVLRKEGILLLLYAYMLLTLISAYHDGNQSYMRELEGERKIEYLLYTVYPVSGTIITISLIVWSFLEIISVCFNTEKRSVSDFIAGTVVLRRKNMSQSK